MRIPAALIAASLLAGCSQEYDIIAPDPEIPKAPAPGAPPQAVADASGEVTGPGQGESGGDIPPNNEDTPAAAGEDTGAPASDAPAGEEDIPTDDPPPPGDTSSPEDTGEPPIPEDPPEEIDTDIDPGTEVADPPPPEDTDVEEPPPPPPEPHPRVPDPVPPCESILPATWETFSLPGGRESMVSHVGDIDGDGTLDAAWVNQQDKNVSIFWGGSILDGAGPENVSIGRSEGYITWGDVNGDGTFDIISSNQDSGLVRIVPGLASGGAGASYTVSISGFPQPVLLDDADGDGNLDLIVGLGYLSKTAMLRGTGAGSFGPPVDFIPGAARQLRLGDLDGDGSKEYIQSYSGGLYSRGGGAPFASVPKPSGGAVWGMWPYDYDADGRDEIVAHVWGGGATSWLELWTWDPAGGLEMCGQSGAIPMAGIDRVTGLGDLDGDGIIDLTGQTTCPSCSSTYHVILGGE